MEYVRSLMQKDPHPNGVIILIARLGKGETNREFNRRRLFNVRERYTKTLEIPPDKIVAAEGERVNGFGRVEIYWRGELAEVLAAYRNKDLHVYCCGPNEMYHPDKGVLGGRSKRKRVQQQRG